MTPDSHAADMSHDETGALIGSDKVQGTAVYGADRSKIGRVERVMLEKRTGAASYAVLTFGGFLGIGEKYFPLPWNQLTYDTDLDGYLVGLTREQLDGSPSYDSTAEPDWDDSTWTGKVRGHYDRDGIVPPIGMV